MSIDLISGRGGLGVEIRGVALWSTPRRNQKRAIEKGRQGGRVRAISFSTLRDYPNPRLVWGTRNTSSTDSNLRTNRIEHEATQRPGGGACLSFPGSSSDLCEKISLMVVTWLILPVVICLSQRLSHACLSVNNSYETANGSLNQLSFI